MAEPVDQQLIKNISTWLRHEYPKSYCDQCIANRLRLPLPTISLATEQFNGRSDFQRQQSECSLCRRSEMTTRINW